MIPIQRMNSNFLSPTLTNESPMRCSKKRRTRDCHSPDLFADEDDSIGDIETSPTDSALGSSFRLSQDSSHTVTKLITLSKTPTPEHKFVSPLPAQLPSQENGMPSSIFHTSSPKPYSDSLMSTASSNHFGLNTRIKAAIIANGSNGPTPAKLLRFSSNSPSSGTTPPVYTLNNGGPITQKPDHSGPHYGLSLPIWKAIQECKGIQSLYAWQEECMKKALSNTLNLIYSLPTSGGKTLVAELLMIREMLCNEKNCIYVLPYVSIVQEKIRTLSTLAVALNFSLEEYAGNRGSYPPRKHNP